MKRHLEDDQSTQQNKKMIRMDRLQGSSKLYKKRNRNKNKAKTVKVELLHPGNDDFESLAPLLCEPVMNAVRTLGFTAMREIQAATIPLMLAGHNVRGTAPTGSGKTLSYLIPTLDRLARQYPEPLKDVCMIIITPTRELATQAQTMLGRMTAGAPELQHFSVVTAIGGTNKGVETFTLRQGANILIATPGRLLDHLQNTKRFSVPSLSCLVLDEADKILNSGFEPTVKEILKILPVDGRQTMLLSATRGGEVEKLADKALGEDYEEVDITADFIIKLHSNVQHEYVRCPTFLRFGVLHNLLQQHKRGKAMVFFNHCRAVNFFTKMLNATGIVAKCIHGKMTQNARNNVFAEFQTASTMVLLCTDVAARGWDIASVEFIVQVDPPTEMSEFVHRVGRAARTEGSKGRAVLFLRPEEHEYLRHLKQEHNVRPRELTLSPPDMHKKMYDLVEAEPDLRTLARKCASHYREGYLKLTPKTCFSISTLSQLHVDASFAIVKELPPQVVKKYLKKHNLQHLKPKVT